MTDKFCKNCKHFKRRFLSENGCKIPTSVTTDLVTGEKTKHFASADWQRRVDPEYYGLNVCGITGRNFQQK